MCARGSFVETHTHTTRPRVYCKKIKFDSTAIEKYTEKLPRARKTIKTVTDGDNINERLYLLRRT